MATIQIREVPDQTYEVLRLRARAAGQSLQTYMRDQVIQLADRRTKEQLWQSVEAGLQGEGERCDLERVLAELDADRN